MNQPNQPGKPGARGATPPGTTPKTSNPPRTVSGSEETVQIPNEEITGGDVLRGKTEHRGQKSEVRSQRPPTPDR